MKKNICTFIFLFLILAVSPSVYAEEADSMRASAFFLPASLKEIGDEAFSGTAVQTVVVQNGAVKIGNRAFADIGVLTDLYLPPSIESIGIDAFSNDTVYTIHGVKGSYAEEWAEKHKVPFTKSDFWRLSIRSDDSLYSHAVLKDLYKKVLSSQVEFRILYREERKDWSFRPQDRSELSPIDCRFP